MMVGCDNLTWGVAGGPARHIPVMLPEVLGALAPADGETYIDGTFGAGGYTAAILGAADCRVIAIDRDPSALAAGKKLKEKFGDRLELEHGRFSQMDQVAANFGAAKIDGIALDIGVSSMQLDQAERGFSFQVDGPLDMRMGASGPSAADIVNQFDEAELARIIWILGEERRSRAIAKAILKARENTQLARTGELANIVEAALGGRRGAKRHPATKTFQALRMLVNQELEELARGLFAAESILRDGGRLVVVAFHSLEDRMVKHFFDEASGHEAGSSRHMPPSAEGSTNAVFSIKGRRAVKPSKVEVSENPRARSARLRSAVRTEAPAREFEPVLAGLPELPSLPERVSS